MARQMHRLSALQVSRAKWIPYRKETREKPKRKTSLYHDGAGLYLQVGQSGSKSWVFRYMLRGRTREMGLGALNAISLKEARSRAEDCRRLLHDKIDPIEERKRNRLEKALKAAKSIKFKEYAKEYIKEHRAGWTPKHTSQWENTLTQYVYPVIGHLAVADVDSDFVTRVLKPIWNTKTETATRVRGRIEKILSSAKVLGYRSGDNPARWHDHLEVVFGKPSEVAELKHHAALPYAEVGEFVRKLRAQNGVAARALEFTILTAARTGEIIGATWGEIDLEKRVWTIPANRMKGGDAHRVPLCDRAIKILKDLRSLDIESSENGFVFPGQQADKALSNMAMLALLKRMGHADVTTHGFRSSFRDWAAECTNTPREVCEIALAHKVGDKTEAAYWRGDVFDRRLKLMAAWEKHCERTPQAKVVPLHHPHKKADADR